MPTAEDRKRLKAVSRRLHARDVLLATWKKGSEAKFFSPGRAASERGLLFQSKSRCRFCPSGPG
jgi:hypothetical protein